MVEIIVIDDEKEKRKNATPMQDINKVYEHCRFGKFHGRVLCASFLGYVADILVTSTSSYLLPSAECDLNMNLRQKGLLNAMPFLGTFFSSIISGFLVDTFGRIYFLRIGFGGIFCFTVIAASSQSFEMLATAKFFEGCLFAACVSASSSLISEFCHSSIRDRVMLCYSSIAAIGQIICPAMAWGILVQNWKHSFFDEGFVLNTWNFYLYIMSLWSLAAYIFYSTLPESPKYLITQGKYAEAKKILIKIYTLNTGKPADTFPMPDLWSSEIKETKLKETDIKKASIQHRLATGLQNIKPMFKKPLLIYLTVLSSMQFMIIGMYNVLRLWFPQLSTIVEHYKLDEDRNFCALLDIYTDNLKLRSNSTLEVCVPALSGAETYINGMIIGTVCLIPYFATGLLVSKLRKKVLLAAFGMICCVASLCLQWSNSKTMMVALFSVDIAVGQIIKTLIQHILLETFPTTMRSLAMSIVMLQARIGALVGNIGFPILIDLGCALPFNTMAGMMICLIILSCFLPKKKQ